MQFASIIGRVAAFAAFLAPLSAGAVPTFFAPTPTGAPGPVVNTNTPYLSENNNPFLAPLGLTANLGPSDLTNGFNHLEKFEDANGNSANIRAGVTVNGSVIPPGFGGIIDSVRGDYDPTFANGDSGVLGHSLFNGSAATGIEVVFDSEILGGLPTHVGLVWTDGSTFQNITVRLEAFDLDNNSLGFVENAVGFNDTTNGGGTSAEDRFYGVIDDGGISRILMTGTGGGGIEVDHLTFGAAVNNENLPEPAALALLGVGLVGLGALQRRGRASKITS